MVNVVYLDVYFCFNFLMDFFVLYITSKFLNQRHVVSKICISALIGAIYAVFVLIVGSLGLLEYLFTYFIVPIVMTIIVVKPKNIKTVLKFCSMIYLFTFILSGIIYAVYYSGNIGRTLLERTINGRIFEINILLILAVIIFIFAISDCIKRNIKKDINLSKYVYDVTLSVADVKIRANGLRDTGNQLVEPITGKPVMIIEEDLIKNVDRKKLKHVVIPYNSVGRKHGIMDGFIGDTLEIDGYTINRPIVGIHKGRLSSGNEYNLILPPNMCEEERV